jgi:hypothetical protein
MAGQQIWQSSSELCGAYLCVRAVSTPFSLSLSIAWFRTGIKGLHDIQLQQGMSDVVPVTSVLLR